VRPELHLAKHAGDPQDANHSGRLDAGDRIAYTFTAANTGTGTITDLAITDPLAGAVTCPTTRLAPGESVICVAAKPYVITQVDLDAGTVQNQAIATGTDTHGDPVGSNRGETTSTLPGPPALALVKSATLSRDADHSGGITVGDQLTYRFTITNTGTVTGRRFTITDRMLTDAGIVIDCPAAAVSPGQSVVCTGGPYTISAADVDHGQLTNVATASADTPSGGVVGSETASVTTTIHESDHTGSGGEPDHATPPSLAATGADFGIDWLISGAVALAAGAGLLFRRRRA
jgi:uncharacterized repeat protein (TIGR01451 family)/LPXTG-motif cell wall-anchored protein